MSTLQSFFSSLHCSYLAFVADYIANFSSPAPKADFLLLLLSLHGDTCRPFSSCYLPLFLDESLCKTLHIKMSFICMKISGQGKHVFIWMVSHKDLFWHWDKTQLGNGLCQPGFQHRFSLIVTFFRWKHHHCACLNSRFSPVQSLLKINVSFIYDKKY